MTSASMDAGSSIALLQSILLMFDNSTQYGSYLCPATISANTANSTIWDYVIIGAGTAGSVLANRLSECSDKSILMIDEGGCPPLESLHPAFFPTIPQSVNDYAYDIFNDSYTCQNKQPQGGVTAGKMWGGTGSLNHLVHCRGSDADYEPWCAATGDPSWCGDELNKHMAKPEAVFDDKVFAQNSYMHGTDGPISLKRQESCYMDFVFAGANELDIPTTDDMLPTSGRWANFPLLAIGNGTRTCGNAGYMKDTLKRSNVKYLTARVDKVIIENNIATGVQLTASNVTYTVTASKVIVSAGTIGSPVILLRSGIGNKTALNELGINCVLDNPDVGLNMGDHVGFPFVTTLNDSASPILSGDPHEFPVPMATIYQAINSSQSYPDCQNIVLLFPANTSGLLQLCYNGFKYNPDICDKIYNTYQPILFHVLNLLHPDSTGSVCLNDTDIYGDPIIKLDMFSNSTDLAKAAACLDLNAKLLNTAAFQSKGAKFLDMGLCNEHIFNTTEYWQCHALAMSTTNWHFVGTCMMGKVVDAELNVIGIKNLKVIDASVMPGPTSGHISSPVLGIAEKAADMMKDEYGCLS